MKAAVTPLATSQRQFILNAIKHNRRLDGRDMHDFRPIKMHFGVEYGSVEVQLGRTRVLAVVTSEVTRPATRREEGRLYFNVELSPMASPLHLSSDVIDRKIMLERRLEQCFVESAAVDLESLCIIAGEKVWWIRVDVHILDDVGNILDCASIASIVALAYFRRPAVSVIGEDVTIHTADEKDLVPLSIHHMPICISFAFFYGSNCMVVDPTNEEEDIMDSKLIMALNRHREICTIQFTGGVTLSIDQILRCCDIALVKATQITQVIQRALNDNKINHVVDASSVGTLSPNGVVTTEEKEGYIDITKSMEIDIEASNDGLGVEETPKNVIVAEGENTAEIGLGGPSTWEIIDSVDQYGQNRKRIKQFGKSETMQGTSTHGFGKEKEIITKTVDSDHTDKSDSEEEVTHVLYGEDISMDNPVGFKKTTSTHYTSGTSAKLNKSNKKRGVTKRNRNK